MCIVERKKKRDGEGKLWIGVWMRENEREGGGNSWRMREKEWENNKTSKFFQMSNYERVLQDPYK